MLRTTGWPRHKGAKRPRSVSLKEAARMIASGATPADVARQLGCSRLRLLRLINHDARFKAMLTQLVGEQVAEISNVGADQDQLQVRREIQPEAIIESIEAKAGHVVALSRPVGIDLALLDESSARAQSERAQVGIVE